MSPPSPLSAALSPAESCAPRHSALEDQPGVGERGRRIAATVLSLLMITIVVGFLGVTTISRDVGFSPIDEQTHTDYAWQLVHGTLPYAGSYVGDEVLELWACHGQVNVPLPECGAEAHPSDFPARGENYNFKHPPVYYAVTGYGASALQAVFDIDFLVAARLLSLVWVWSGIVALFFVLRSLDLSYPTSTSASILVLLFPPILSSATTVNPDAAAVWAGVAAAVLVKIALVDSRLPTWLLALLSLLLGAAIASTKIMNALAVLAAAGVVLLAGLFSSGFKGRRLRTVASGFAVPVGVLIVYVGWARFQKPRAAEGWISPIKGANTTPIEGLFIDEWLTTMFKGFNLTSGYYLGPPITSWMVSVWASILMLFTVGIGVFGYYLVSRKRKEGYFALALTVGLLIWPTLVQLEVLNMYWFYFKNISTRYGISLIPMVCLVLALFARKNSAGKGLVALTALGVTIASLAVLGVGVGGL